MATQQRGRFLGNLYMWGKSDNGQLGIGVNQINVPTPTLLSSLSVKGNPVVSVAACSDKCYAVLANGDLFRWGGYPESKPMRFFEHMDNLKVRSIHCGLCHSALLLGEVFMWGRNYFGQLGLGNTEDQATPTRLTTIPSRKGKIISISCGYEHTAALLDSGQVFTWGSNDLGALGLSIDFPSLFSAKPVQVTRFLDNKYVTKISCDMTQHTGALTDSGELFMWGSNGFGELLSGNRAPRHEPGAVLLPNMRASSFVCQYNSTGIIFESGTVVVGGSVCSYTDTNPCKFLEFSDKVHSIAFGHAHMAILFVTGHLLTWGDNSNGALGNGLYEAKFCKSLEAVHLPKNTTAIAILCGDNFSGAIVVPTLPTWPELKPLLVGWKKDRECCLHYSQNIPLSVLQYIIELAWECQLPTPLKVLEN